MYVNHPFHDGCIKEVTNTIHDSHCFLGRFFTGSSLLQVRLYTHFVLEFLYTFTAGYHK